MDNAPRSATVVAGINGSRVLKLSSEVFMSIMSRVAAVLEERQDQYEWNMVGGGK